MAGISYKLTMPKLGTSSPSALVRSSASLSSATTNYRDALKSYEYANSAYTDEAFSTYRDYLQTRITQLQSTGTVADAQKALSLMRTLESATHSNISSNIARESIGIMAGNATLQDKYDVTVSGFQRAMGIGDMTLAQSLEQQAYSISQQIQYQRQQAADAAATLAKAGNGTTTGTSGVTYQGEVVSNLTEALRSFAANVKNTSKLQLDKSAAAWANSQKDTLKTLGVNITTQSPNYFDVVNGIAGAIYNAQVLKAQAEAPINPLLSRTYASEAQDYLSGAKKFDTAAGSLTMTELQQAMSDPGMFSYDNSNGKYVRNTTTGYQYITTQDAAGQSHTTLAPTYSGMVPKTTQGGDNVYFLTPNQTNLMNKLGLNFTENTSGANAGTTGNGVRVQASQDSPQWLRNILGNNGVANMYTTNQGSTNLDFKAGSVTGQGDANGEAYYTIMMDERGLHGVFEHTPTGQAILAGGDYGFDAQAAHMLINAGMKTQYTIKVQTAQREAAAAQLVAQQAQDARLAAIRMNPAPAPQAPTAAARLQPATYRPPELNTFNPQQASPGGTSFLQPAGQYTQNVSGVPLRGNTNLPGIRL